MGGGVAVNVGWWNGMLCWFCVAVGASQRLRVEGKLRSLGTTSRVLYGSCTIPVVV